jgi:hypothetical protein
MHFWVSSNGIYPYQISSVCPEVLKLENMDRHNQPYVSSFFSHHGKKHNNQSAENMSIETS